MNNQQWSEYLFYRDNPKGDHFERWCHRHGCGLWFNVVRDTLTHRLGDITLMSQPVPVKGD